LKSLRNSVRISYRKRYTVPEIDNNSYAPSNECNGLNEQTDKIDLNVDAGKHEDSLLKTEINISNVHIISFKFLILKTLNVFIQKIIL